MNGRLRQMNDERGFTLVEILTVIFILGILAALAIPSLSEWINKSQVRSGIEDVQSGLQLAQSEAAKRNMDVEFSLLASQPVPASNVLNTAAAANGSYWTVRILPTGSGVNKTFVQGGDFGSRGVNITGPATLIFSGIGRVLTSAGTPPTFLTVTQVYRVETKTNKYPMCVLVRPGGGVRWCDPNITSAGSPLACPADIVC